MTTAFQIFHLPKSVPLNAGVIMPGAKASFFITETSTPSPVYTDPELQIAHTQPVEADAAGILPTIYLDPAITYKVTLTTAADVLYYTIDPANDQLLSQAVIGGLLYPRTDAEVAASVTPTDYAIPPGWVTRYGAVGDDTTDDAPAIQAALDQAAEEGGAPVRIPVPPIAYKLDSQLNITPERSIAIIGEKPGWTSSLLPNDVGGGVCLRLDAAAGAGAAILDCAGFIMGLYISGIHFYTREVGLQHVGIRLQEALQTNISECRFQGGSSASDDQIGIHLLDPVAYSGTYTGSLTIHGCYFTSLKHSIQADGNFTTGHITDCDISGYLGSTTGIWLKADCVGIRIVASRIEGCATGFLDAGVGNDFSHNYLENNTLTQDRTAANLPISIGNTIVSGGAGTFPTDRTTARIQIQPRTFVVDDTRAQFGLGYRERYRDFDMGGFPTYTPTFSANNSMTFTSVTTSTNQGSTTTLRHNVYGRDCTIDFFVDGTVGGTPSTELRFTLPTDFNAPSGRVLQTCQVFNAGAYAPGKIEIRNGESFARVTLQGGGSWTAGAAGFYGRIGYLANN